MYSETHEINVIIREFEDGDMLRSMAAENDDFFRMTPAAINETVKAVRDFLHSPAGEKDYKKLRNASRLPADGKSWRVESPVIAEFLGWTEARVRESLAELSDIEDEVLEKEVIEKMPTQKHATVFRQEVKRMDLRSLRQSALYRRSGIRSDTLCPSWPPARHSSETITKLALEFWLRIAKCPTLNSVFLSRVIQE